MMSIFDDSTPSSWVRDGLLTAPKPRKERRDDSLPRFVLGTWRQVVAITVMSTAVSVGAMRFTLPPGGVNAGSVGVADSISGMDWIAEPGVLLMPVAPVDPSDSVHPGYWSQVQDYLEGELAALPSEISGEDPDPII